MKRKLKLITSMVLIVAMLLSVIPGNYITKVSADDSATSDEVVLYEGTTSATGSWDPWATLVDITDMDLTNFENPFTIQIDYEGTNAPYLIFQSWSGGSSWAQVTASYTSKGIAYYTYDACCEAYGTDFSTLNDINIRPGGSDITVTKVSLCPEDDTEVSVNYEGQAGEIVDDINAGWNLGGSLECYGDWIKQGTDGLPERYETAWYNPVTTKAMIDKVKAAGFNAVRIPITWTQHIDESNGYKIDEAWMNRVQEVVNYVIDDGMYAIINIHHDCDDGWFNASDESLENNSEEFKAVWTQIADTFKNYDNSLLFEGFNEMLDENSTWTYPGTEATNAVNEFNQMFVDTVRSTGGNNADRCLVVNTYAASTDGNVLDDFIVPQDTIDNSLIVQVHFYVPYSYANIIGEYTSQTAWKENGGKQTIDGTLINLYNHFTSNNIPVIIGEMAAANKDNLDDRVEYTSYVVDQARDYGIKCFWWDQGGKFEIDNTYGYTTGMGLLNRYTMEWEFPEVVEAFTGVDVDGTTSDVTDEDNTDVDDPDEEEPTDSTDTDTDGAVLFEGSASATGSWDPWETVVDLNSPNVINFENPFTIEIAYEGTSAPYVIFQSWSGGSSWAQVSPSYVSKGIAYYTYNACCEAYGSTDFSTLNDINIRPAGADVTVTKISVVPEDDSDIVVNYEGPAGDVVNNITSGWNLGNTFDCLGDWITQYGNATTASFETAWGNPVTTKAIIDRVKAAGFNSIRIPITWGQHIDTENGYTIDSAWLKRIQQVVDYAMEDDMYCIINIHHDVDDVGWINASEDSIASNGEEFKAVWTQIADNFKDYDNKLLFEGFNEMLDNNYNWNYPGTDGTAAVNTLNQMFVDTVRATGGNNGTRCLVVNTYAASTDGSVLDDFVMPQDTVENSLIAQIHFYTPYAYANVWGEWTQQTAWKDNGGKALIDGTLLNVYKHFSSQGIPVIMGEIGVANKDNLEDRTEYLSYVVNECHNYGIKCFYWDEGGTFEANEEYGYHTGMALLNRRTLEWVYPELVEAFTGVCPSAEADLLLGDVNNDKVVNLHDYIALRLKLSGNYSGEYNEANADINSDGSVNVKDLLELRIMI